MDSTSKRSVDRIESLLQKSEEVLNTSKSYGVGHDYVDKGLYAAFRTQALTCLIDIVGSDHPYSCAVDTSYVAAYTTPDNVKVIRGVLQSLQEDLENGYLQSIRELIHAEVFVDFIEMSESLLSSGYKDAAAVIIGSVLENHLRQLAVKFNISPTSSNKDGSTFDKKASVLNDQLAKAGAYPSTYQKQIAAWLALRNAAAHGSYLEYSKEQVELMKNGVIPFLSQFPA